jgi:DNA repair exonuclease SbcCD ATPase subunit
MNGYSRIGSEESKQRPKQFVYGVGESLVNEGTEMSSGTEEDAKRRTRFLIRLGKATALVAALIFLETAMSSAPQTTAETKPADSRTGSAGMADVGPPSGCAVVFEELRGLRRDLVEWRLGAHAEKLGRLQTALEQLQARRISLTNTIQALTARLGELETQLQSAPSGSEQHLIMEAEKVDLANTQLERLRDDQLALDRQEVKLQAQLLKEQEQRDALQRQLQGFRSHP